MFGNGLIAAFIAVGAAMWVYKKTSYKGRGDFVKQVTPAVIAGILAFLITLTIFWSIF